MAKEKGKVKAFFKDVKTHWNTPPEGKYVPYREYLSIFGATGGDYTLSYLKGFLKFEVGCYLVAFYYQIPLLTFAAINTFFLASTYLWNILSMGVDANLGFLPKKVERKYFAVYLLFIALGLVLLIFDFASFLPETVRHSLDSRWPGIDSVSIFKIFGAHFLVNSWGGFREIIIRKLLLKKFGRYKIFTYANLVQGVAVAILICWLPLYELPMAERVWKLFLLFQFYTIFEFVGHTEKVARNISPDQQERLIINSIPVKLGHILQNIVNFLLPTIAGAMFIDGIRDLNMFRYLLPAFFVISAVMTLLSIGKIKERIPAPPIEKKEYFSFWTCVSGIFKNKYLWITYIVRLLDSLGNGMLSIHTILLIYTWRETGLLFSVAEIVLKFAGTPGQFLAPWIRKRFQFKSLMVFNQLVNAGRSVVYILAILFLGKTPWACGILLFIALFIGNALSSAIGIIQSDMEIRVSDYQMYISGERFEGYQKIIEWFTKPITSLVGLIIPLMFVGFGFTSDWDVLYMDDVRFKCMLVGVAFDLAGYLLMTLPYLLFWDYTDEKHKQIMKELQERADALADKEKNDAVTVS